MSLLTQTGDYFSVKDNLNEAKITTLILAQVVAFFVNESEKSLNLNVYVMHMTLDW